MSKVTVNTTQVNKMFKELKNLSEEVMKDGYKYFKSNTPIKNGNARRRTRLEKKNRIGARYSYADRLDTGWSKQAPNGMTEPTSEELEILVGKYIKRVT